MPIKRQTYRLDQIDDWQGPVQQSGPTRDAAAQRVRDRLAGMSPTERVLSELTERPPTPRAAFPLRENAQTSRPMPPTAGQMFLDAGLGALEAFDQPPTGMRAGMPYTTPLRLLSASAAVPSALAARAYDASSGGSVMADAPVVDPLRPAEEQSMFSPAIAQRGGGRGAQALGLVADIFTPDLTDFATGGLPLAAMAGGLKRVNTGRTLVNGLYSRLDEAAAMIPTKGVPATGVLNWLKKAPEGISLEEVAYRKLPEWLESQGTKTVTPEMLAAHLRENPAPFPQVKTLGEAPVENRWGVFQGDNMFGSYDTQAAANAAVSHAPDRLSVREVPVRIQRDGSAKFSRYQVPGGKNYRETLLTLPPKQKTMSFEEFVSQQEPGGVERSPGSRIRYSTYLNALENQYLASHYPDDPNLLVHTRANERTLPSGEPGRFIEEVQSDWHQQGLKKGYRGRFGLSQAEKDELTDLNQLPDKVRTPDQTSRLDALFTKAQAGVPDAPFKENWPDLGLKQQLIETANDPNAKWLGFTGGKTQADRYDLSKTVSKIEYIPPEGSLAENPNGYRPGVLRAYDHNGDRVINKVADPSELPDLIGKEASEKLLQTEARTDRIEGRYTRPQHGLSGLDLQVGGEGMTAFYDQKLPKRLEKLVKPFGGTVETTGLGSGSRSLPDIDENGVFLQPAWMSRLTPEMKAAMRERGFPLMSLAGPVAAQGIPDDPNSETDDYARLALNMGSMAALGMAAKGMARGSAPDGGSLAELTSKRMSAAEAEAAGYWHPIGDGKKLNMPPSQMRYERWADPDIASRMPDQKVMRLADLEGSALVPAIGDRSMAGHTLTSVGGTELPTPVKLEGGPGFMRTQDAFGAAWASEKGKITGIGNKVRTASKASLDAGGTGEVYLVYFPGTHGTTDYSTMMSDALLEQIKGGTFTKKAVQEFDAYVRNLRPEWLGLMHPKARTQLNTTTGELRHAFADAVELKSMQEMGFPDIAQTRAAITEPDLLDVPTYHGGYAVAKADPSGRAIANPVAPHTTYNTQLAGSYAGALEKNIPFREMFSDFVDARRAKGQPSRGDDYAFLRATPFQVVTSEWVKKNSGKLQSMGMVAVPVAAGAAAMQSDKPKNGRKTYRLDQIDR